MPSTRPLHILPAMLLCVCLGPTASAQTNQAPSPEQILAAQKTLIQRIKAAASSDNWDGTPPPGRTRAPAMPTDKQREDFDTWKTTHANHGGNTALAVTALLTAGINPKEDEQLAAAIEWLKARPSEIYGTYAVSMRLQAFARLLPTRPDLKPIVQRDVSHLVSAQLRNGNWWYQSVGSGREDDMEGTNSNGQLALLGLWAAACTAEISVPASVWKLAEQRWLSTQNPDGGWGYKQQRFRTHSYGAMTASGVATLYIVNEQLHADRYIQLREPVNDQPIQKGIAWLGQHFRPDANVYYRPGDAGTRTHWLYWLYSVERAGQAGGLRYLPGEGPGVDWFAQGAQAAIRYAAGPSNGLEADCFALLFLAKGAGPLFAWKLQHNADWNARPHDLAAVGRYLRSAIEREVTWQVINLDAPLEQLAQAPILYVQGTRMPELSDAHRTRLREYLDHGGLLLCEATAARPTLPNGFRSLITAMYPAAASLPLQQHKDVYSLIHPLKSLRGEVLSLDDRPIAIFIQQDLSRELQRNAIRSSRECFDLFVNLYALQKRRELRQQPQPARQPASEPPSAPAGPANPPVAGTQTPAANPPGPAGPIGDVVDVADAQTIQQALARGDSLTLRGTVARVNSNPRGTALYIEFANVPREGFYAVVLGEARIAAFRQALGAEPAAALAGKSVRIKGKLADYRGRAQIVLVTPDQLVIEP